MVDTEQMLKDLADEAVKYKSAIASAKVKAKHELNARVLELSVIERTALSQMMHDFHARGLAKDKIRAATGFYNNAMSFNPVWDQYTPLTKTDLRLSRTSSSETKKYRWLNDGALYLELKDGSAVDILDAVLRRNPDDEDETWVEFTLPIGYDDRYGEIHALVTAALEDRATEEPTNEEEN